MPRWFWITMAASLVVFVLSVWGVSWSVVTMLDKYNERQIERCMEYAEGMKHPPSCLSGFTAQQRPVDDYPSRNLGSTPDY